MSHVSIRVAPSRTGPTLGPWTSIPLSSIMMAFEGGTKTKSRFAIHLLRNSLELSSRLKWLIYCDSFARVLHSAIRSGTFSRQFSFWQKKTFCGGARRVNLLSQDFKSPLFLRFSKVENEIQRIFLVWAWSCTFKTDSEIELDFEMTLILSRLNLKWLKIEWNWSFYG